MIYDIESGYVIPLSKCASEAETGIDHGVDENACIKAKKLYRNSSYL